MNLPPKMDLSSESRPEVTIGFKKRSRKVVNVRTKIKDEDDTEPALDDETM